MEEKEINDDFKKYYEILKLLGYGQYAKIYKGINKKTKEIKAIKVIQINNDEEEIFYKNIHNEITNMKICSENNNNSVKIYEYYHYKDKIINGYAIIMELCDNNYKKY